MGTAAAAHADAVAALLTDSDNAVVERTVACLDEMGEAGARAVAARLTDSDKDMRIAAAGALGKMASARPHQIQGLRIQGMPPVPEKQPVEIYLITVGLLDWDAVEGTLGEA